MDHSATTRCQFDRNIVIIGFGSIAQAVLPLLFRHLAISKQQIKIITKKKDALAIANEYGVPLLVQAVTKDNYESLLSTKLQAGDFLLNLSVDVSSIDLIQFCQVKEVLYLDTCIEPWQGGYTDPTISPSARSNYMLREAALQLRKTTPNQTTALITHGANPGLVSHLVKRALLQVARDTEFAFDVPTTQTEWAMLAAGLQVKAIHIAEHDTQKSAVIKNKNEFVNTWSVDGFVGEGSQPAELGWGSHEKYWPFDAHKHQEGSGAAIYLNRPGAATRVRTWTPLAGSFHGFLITHGEAISIADYYTVKKDDTLIYRPTVHYAYHPCEQAVLSLHELAGREWQQQPKKRLLVNEIESGMDELGVLLMGHQKNAYWFGSQLTIDEARTLAPHNNATSLQVVAAVLGGMIWVIKHPSRGIVEPDEIDADFVLDIAAPYLGKLVGEYTTWTPLTAREQLFSESIDRTDPWQFLNVRVN